MSDPVTGQTDSGLVELVSNTNAMSDEIDGDREQAAKEQKEKERAKQAAAAKATEGKDGTAAADLEAKGAAGPLVCSVEAGDNGGIVPPAEQKQTEQPYDPSKTGPEDPTDPGKPLYQNPVVKKASDEAFMLTENGKARDGKAEAGFSIEYKDGKISIDNKVNSVHGGDKANELQVSTDLYTIAILHTHGNNLDPKPSLPVDYQPHVPDFVRSAFALYVTVPNTHDAIQLIPSPSK